MKIDVPAVRKTLKAFDFKTLFYEHLGWDKHQARLDIPVDDNTVSLTAIAQKRGFVAFVCDSIPDRKTRLKIDHQVTKSAREHFVIYADGPAGQQLWHWVRREPGKPLASRDHRYHNQQSGEALIQRLDQIAVTLDEEEEISISDVARRIRSALDVDKITKKFYDRFKTEHIAFQKLITGFPPPVKISGKSEPHPDLQWYTSLMLNRLMFVYFIQKKGFLDGDTDYLRNRLAMVKVDEATRLVATKRDASSTITSRDLSAKAQAGGSSNFFTFYRYFLIRLFHEGLGRHEKDRQLDRAMEKLLGKVPFLNGGFFEVHPLETKYPDIDIPDAAFERIFDFFDQYRWHLDERPLRADNEINPDVVGYIFEKYINQKQMGAYYTKEDITEYISKNTIIPYLFDAAKKKCSIAFKPDSALWRLLQDDPDRYIYPAVRHGVIDEQGKIIPLPAEIEAGIDTVAKRNGWNKTADAPYALPTETWREHVARRQRCLEIREKLRRGEIHEINDLITLNLDIWQFARDAIVNAEGPELLRAFWNVLTGHSPAKSNDSYEPGMSVLDPTCGSGAFVFSALCILESLYSDCLERMGRFIEDNEARMKDEGGRMKGKKFTDFRQVLGQIGNHPNERYFILKSIIINNLFGVDIMEEAVEICKLRLFLKLVAQLESPDQIEPLPDIDFNFRAGNTLVGYASAQQVRKAFTEELDGKNVQGRLMLGTASDDYARFEEALEIVDHAFRQFRRQQTQLGGSVTAEDKQNLRDKLARLDDKLDRYLAGEYGIDPKKTKAFANWQESHQPFHWFVDFYGIMQGGGFDVIIGNPPYLEYKEVGYAIKDFDTVDTRAIHAVCIERGVHLLQSAGCMSMIVPLALVSTQRMKTVQSILESHGAMWYANFAWRPGKLFDTVNRALTIFTVSRSGKRQVYTTGYQKWTSDTRSILMPQIAYVATLTDRSAFWVPKLSNRIEPSILAKLLSIKEPFARHISQQGPRIYYRTTGGLYWKVFTDFAPAFEVNGAKGHSSRETWFCLLDGAVARTAVAVLSSNLFWWWYTITSNLRDLNPSDIQHFPLAPGVVGDTAIEKLGKRYLEHLDRNSIMLVRHQKQTGKTETQSFKIQMSKPIIDEIDRVLAKHYGFTDEELDFIINYDIKYRMGGAEED